MDSNPLFSGISPEQRSQMLCCFHPEYRNFQKGETILTYAAFATGVPPYIYAFHRYTRNSACLSITQEKQFQMQASG